MVWGPLDWESGLGSLMGVGPSLRSPRRAGRGLWSWVAGPWSWFSNAVRRDLEVPLGIRTRSEVFVGAASVPMPAGAWSGGLWGSRLGWRWGLGRVGGGPAAPQWREVCGGPRGGGRGLRPPRPAPRVCAPSPCGGGGGGVGRRAARRAELGGGSGGRAGGGRRRPRGTRAPSPGPPPTMARSGGGGAGPRSPPGWVSAARSGRGGGGGGGATTYERG